MHLSNCDLIEDDGDYVEIDGVGYKIDHYYNGRWRANSSHSVWIGMSDYMARAISEVNYLES
jgi:hypothetical protein